MSNMSYCMFENTLNDLRDCYEVLAIHKMGDDIESESEEKSRKRLIKLCHDIAADFDIEE